MDDIDIKPSQYYATVDADGEIVGFYVVPDIHAVAPVGAVEITEDDWRLYAANGGRQYKHDGAGFRGKTDAELAAEIAALPPAPKSSEQLQLDDLTLAIADIYAGGAA